MEVTKCLKPLDCGRAEDPPQAPKPLALTSPPNLAARADEVIGWGRRYFRYWQNWRR
jgi:hypothetical protein